MSETNACKSRWLALLGVFAATGFVTAQNPEPSRAVRLQPIAPQIERLSPIQDGRGALDQTMITVRGFVQNSLGQLVPRAGTILIRSLADGRVVGGAEVDARAEFSVRGFSPGLYMAEVVGPTGAVLTTTGAFTATAGAIVQLAPVIPTRSSEFFSFWESATSTVVTAAATSGILLVNSGQPVTPQ